MKAFIHKSFLMGLSLLSFNSRKCPSCPLWEWSL